MVQKHWCQLDHNYFQTSTIIKIKICISLNQRLVVQDSTIIFQIFQSLYKNKEMNVEKKCLVLWENLCNFLLYKVMTLQTLVMFFSRMFFLVSLMVLVLGEC